MRKFLSLLVEHLGDYPTPANFSYRWSFGPRAGIFLVVQLVSGIILAVHYVSDIYLSVEHFVIFSLCDSILRYAPIILVFIFFIIGSLFTTIIFFWFFLLNLPYIPSLFQFLAILLLFFIRLDGHYSLESAYFTYGGLMLCGLIFIFIDYYVKRSVVYKESSVGVKFFLFLPFVLTSFCIFIPSFGFIYSLLDFRPINPLTGEIGEIIYNKYFFTLKYVLRPEDSLWVRERILEILSTNVNLSRAEALSWKTKICSLVENGTSISVINAFISENKKSLELVPVSETLTKPRYDNLLVIGSALALLALGRRLLYWCFKPRAVRYKSSNVSKSVDTKKDEECADVASVSTNKETLHVSKNVVNKSDVSQSESSLDVSSQDSFALLAPNVASKFGTLKPSFDDKLSTDVLLKVPLRCFKNQKLGVEKQISAGLDRLKNKKDGVISVKFGSAIEHFEYGVWFSGGNGYDMGKNLILKIYLMHDKALAVSSKLASSADVPFVSYQIDMASPLWMKVFKGIVGLAVPVDPSVLVNKIKRIPPTEEVGRQVLLPEVRVKLHTLIQERWRSLVGISDTTRRRIAKLLVELEKFF